MDSGRPQSQHQSRIKRLSKTHQDSLPHREFLLMSGVILGRDPATGACRSA